MQLKNIGSVINLQEVSIVRLLIIGPVKKGQSADILMIWAPKFLVSKSRRTRPFNKFINFNVFFKHSTTFLQYDIWPSPRFYSKLVHNLVTTTEIGKLFSFFDYISAQVRYISNRELTLCAALRSLNCQENEKTKTFRTRWWTHKFSM